MREREMTQTRSLRICFMPELLPDELLYSLIGRLTTINALGTPKVRMEQLFGTKDVIPSVDLPSLVDSLQRRLAANSPWRSSSELIDTATIYPYHRPFLTPVRHKVIEKILLGRSGKALKVFMGRVANRFGAAPFLRYCPACTSADIASHGVPYWHRAHQLPGVMWCYLHAVKLVNHVGSVPATDKQRLILAPASTALDNETVEQNPKQIEFAILSRDLLTAGLPALEAERRQIAYRNAAIEHGLTRMGRVDHQALAQAIRHHYCDFAGFAHRERLLSSKRAPLCWLRTLLDRPARAAHPICHLLLIGFLFKTITNFKQAIASEPLRAQPSNINCDKSTDKRALGKALCEELLRNTDLSCRAVARTLKLSVTTVVKHRRVLGVPICDRPKYLDAKRLDPIIRALKDGVALGQIAHAYNVSISTLYRLRAQSPEISRMAGLRTKEGELAHRRAHWSLMIETYRGAGLNAARAAAAATYAWLYRHDRAWLRDSRSKFELRRVPPPRVDWQERDLHLCELVSIYVSKVKTQKKRPRISRTFMTRYLGEALIRANIGRLPRLNLLLEQLEETPVTYQLSRIDRAVESLFESGQPLTNWRIKRSAGIRMWTGMHNAYAAWKAKKLSPYL